MCRGNKVRTKLFNPLPLPLICFHSLLYYFSINSENIQNFFQIRWTLLFGTTPDKTFLNYVGKYKKKTDKILKKALWNGVFQVYGHFHTEFGLSVYHNLSSEPSCLILTDGHTHTMTQSYVCLYFCKYTYYSYKNA